VLCLTVAAIHVIDQGGFPGSKAPTYVAYGYYALELIGAVAAVLLIAGAIRAGWFLATGVAAGPFIGYVLSRGPGLPGYTDDIGNWTEPLGLAALAVEALLVALAATLFLRGTANARQPSQNAASPAPIRMKSTPAARNMRSASRVSRP
jgi:hypothetical protein